MGKMGKMACKCVCTFSWKPYTHTHWTAVANSSGYEVYITAQKENIFIWKIRKCQYYINCSVYRVGAQHWLCVCMCVAHISLEHREQRKTTTTVTRARLLSSVCSTDEKNSFLYETWESERKGESGREGRNNNNEMNMQNESCTIVMRRTERPTFFFSILSHDIVCQWWTTAEMIIYYEFAVKYHPNIAEQCHSNRPNMLQIQFKLKTKKKNVIPHSME